MAAVTAAEEADRRVELVAAGEAEEWAVPAAVLRVEAATAAETVALRAEMKAAAALAVTVVALWVVVATAAVREAAVEMAKEARAMEAVAAEAEAEA